MVAIKSPRGFYAGAIYFAFGLVGLWFGWAYPMGTAGRMGAGYFPKVLSVVLLAFGLIALFRGMTIAGPRIAPAELKPILFIPLACALFGLVLEPVGFIGSLMLLIMLSAMASAEFRWSLRAMAGAVALVAACALIFVWGLSVPMPLIGRWFTGG